MPHSTDQGHKLFVGDLPGDVSYGELQTVFNTYGEIVNIHIMPMQLSTGRRCALLFYTTKQAAEDAIHVLNGIYKIRENAEQPIKVQWAKEKSASAVQSDAARPENQEADGFKLFVGGLPMDCKETELHQVFRTYGEVNKVHILPATTLSGCVAAFVYYSTIEAADDAIEVLDAQYKIREDDEKPIKVMWAAVKKKQEPEGGENAVEKGVEKSGEKSGDAKHRSGDSELQGQGESSKSKSDGDEKEGSKTDEVPQWGNRKGGGKRWTSEQEPTKVRSTDGWKLFVGGLPTDICDEELMSVFSTYGEVKKVHILPPRDDSKRVAAFVFYATDSAADDATKVLNGAYKIRENADLPIQVRWATEKFKGEGADSCKGGGKGWSGESWSPTAWPKGGRKGGKFGKASLGWDAHGWEGGWLAEDAYGWDSGWSVDDGWSAEGWYEAPSWAWEAQAPAWYDKGSGKGKGKKGGKSKGKGGKSKGEWQEVWSGDQKGGEGKDWHGGKSTSDWQEDWSGGHKGGKGKDSQGGPTRGEVSETKLFIGNLPDDITEDALQFVFGTYGKVQNIYIMTGRSRTGQSCAFVEFVETSEADVALSTLHGKYEIRPGYGPILVRKANATRGKS